MAALTGRFDGFRRFPETIGTMGRAGGRYKAAPPVAVGMTSAQKAAAAERMAVKPVRGRPLPRVAGLSLSPKGPQNAKNAGSVSVVQSTR